jgi:autophagy-related protein 16
MGRGDKKRHVMWATALKAQLIEQRAREQEPFNVIAFYQELQARYARLSEELRNTKKDRDRLIEQQRGLEEEAAAARQAAQGFILSSAKERELEERLHASSLQLSAALEQVNHLLKAEHELREARARLEELHQHRINADETITQLQTALAERSNTITVLKRENEALQTENAMQRQQFAKEKLENERLIPTVLNAKRMEAELRNEIVELQQRMLDLAAGNAQPHTPKNSHRELMFTEAEPGGVTAAACVAPSYIAFCNDDAHASEVHCVTVTDNGRQVWSGGAEKAIKGWDGNNGTPVGRFATPASTVCLDTKSTFLVAGCVDFTCRVWHLPTMRAQCQLTGHTEVVTSSYLTPDASKVFTASRDCTIKSWDLHKGALLHTSLCASSCYDLAVTVDRVCTAHFDNTVRLWDVRTGKSAGEIRELHDKAVTSVRISPDNTFCVTLSRDNTIKMVDLRMLKELHKFSDHRLSISSNLARLTLSPDGAFCAAGCTSGEVAVFNIRDLSAAPRFLTKGHTAPVICVCWSPDGRGLASTGLDKRVIFWR